MTDHVFLCVYNPLLRKLHLIFVFPFRLTSQKADVAGPVVQIKYSTFDQPLFQYNPCTAFILAVLECVLLRIFPTPE